MLTHLIPLHLDLPAFSVHPALEILGLALLASLEFADLPVDLVQGDLALPLHALKVAVLLAEPLNLPVQLSQFGVKILRVVIGDVLFFQGKDRVWLGLRGGMGIRVEVFDWLLKGQVLFFFFFYVRDLIFLFV